MEICPNCETNPVRANGRCHTCDEYRRRHDGAERPAHLARRQAELNRARFEDRIARRGR